MKVYEQRLLKHDFYDTAIADVLRAVDGGSLMGAFILSFCCIDYMGIAINPDLDRNTSEEFKAYIESYLAKVRPEYANLKDEIWAVRNSLVHAYGISSATARLKINFQLSFEYPERHLRLIDFGEKKEFWLNGPEFIGEIIGSIEFFFRTNMHQDELLNKWYNKLLIITGAAGYWNRLEVLKSTKSLHKQSHRFLEVLDRDPEETPSLIAEDIANSIRLKVD